MNILDPQAADALHESEERNRAMLRALPDLIFLLSSDGVYLDYHAKDPSRLYLPPEEFLGKRVRDVMPPQIADEFERSIKEIDGSNEAVRREYSLTAGAQELFFEWRMVRCNHDKVLVIVRDITEHKRSEAALRASEELYRTLFDLVPVAVYTCDASSVIREYNQRAIELWGREPERGNQLEKFCGSFRIYYPDGRPMPLDECPMARVLRGEIVPAADSEIVIERPDGSRRNVVALPKLLRNDLGEPVGAVNCLYDITERKRAEETLRESEEHLRLALEAGRMGAWDWNAKTNAVKWSRGHFEIMGIEPFGVQPTFDLWRDHIHPADLPHVLEAHRQTMQKNIYYRAEYRVVWDNGTVRWVESQGTPVCSDSGEVVGLIGLIIDVTERKRAQEELIASKARFEGILDIAEDAIISVTADQRITLFNQGAERIFGYDSDEVLGRQLDVCLPGQLADIHRQHIEDFGHSEISSRRMGQRREIFGQRRDGTRFPAEASISRLDTAHGPVFTVILRDVSDRKRAEEALLHSEERYRSVVDSQTDLICRYLPDTTLTFVNEAYCRYFGKTREQLIGTKFLDLIPQDARADALEHVQSLIANPRVEPDEHEVVQGDGTIGWQRWLDYSITDSLGKMVEFQAIGSDITERKKAQSAVLQRDQLLQAMFHSLSSHVVVLDRNGIVTYASRSWSDFTGDDNGLMENLGLGSNYPEIWRVATEDTLGSAPLDGLKRVMAGDLETLTIEYPSQSNGKERWFLMAVDAMPREHGGVVISHTDITARKQTEQSLGEALAEVRQLKDRLHEENIYLQEAMMVAHDFGEIIGRSEALKRTLRQAEQVAPLDTTVLLTGETGTGKELLAHAIHKVSSRKGHTLVKVNCATLPAQLVESELFGHERGAFTGAHTKRVGRFEIANGGTIFLDEIGELSLDLQAKLLRVLQEGEFERVGSSHTIKVDVRVIAASNRNLEEAVHQGVFRSDLFYRLSIFPITLPPLRERREDIPMLVTHFVKQLGKKLGKQIESVPQDTMDALISYSWPGNVRELRNVIERATIITRGPKLRLLDSLEAGAISDSGPLPTATDRVESNAQVQTLDESQRRLIIQTLDNTYWRIEGPSGAAALLGINPNTLRSRMKKLGISKPRFKHQSHTSASVS